MIPKNDWNANRDEYLERANLVQSSDFQMTLDTLAATLHKQYEQTNSNILSGDNEHVRFHKDGRFHVTTPKIDDEQTEPADSLFPSGQYISLLEILSTVNKLSNFVDAFEPWQSKYARAKPPNKTFFAGTLCSSLNTIGAMSDGGITPRYGANSDDVKHPVKPFSLLVCLMSMSSDGKTKSRLPE